MKVKVNIDIYECTAHLWIVPSTKDVCLTTDKILKKHKLKTENKENDEAWGQCVPTFDNYYIILSKNSLKDYNTFFHELSHCVDAILEDRDVQDEEARAYLAGYIGNHFLKKILKWQEEFS